jgi:hypothetical protein
MKKRSLILLLLLALAAFFAYSPDAILLLRERLRDGEQPANESDKTAPVAFNSLKAANAPEFDLHTNSGGANLGIGGDADLQEIDPAVESEKIARSAAEVPDGELRQALERSLRDGSSSEYRELLQRRWADANPSAAASWATRLADFTQALPLVQQAAIVWANKDMPAAVQWADSLPQGELRTSVITALGYEGARTASFEAFDLVAGLEPSLERDTLIEHMIRQWSATDANQALAWVQQVPDPALRQRLLSALATTAAQQDAPAAAALAADAIYPGPDQNRAAVAIVQRWAQVDPEDAASWVEQFPESDVKTAAEAALNTPAVQ